MLFATQTQTHPRHSDSLSYGAWRLCGRLLGTAVGSGRPATCSVVFCRKFTFPGDLTVMCCVVGHWPLLSALAAGPSGALFFGNKFNLLDGPGGCVDGCWALLLALVARPPLVLCFAVNLLSYKIWRWCGRLLGTSVGAGCPAACSVALFCSKFTLPGDLAVACCVIGRWPLLSPLAARPSGALCFCNKFNLLDGPGGYVDGYWALLSDLVARSRVVLCFAANSLSYKIWPWCGRRLAAVVSSSRPAT